MSADVKFRLGGVWYRWSGWFGCQLWSTEWRCPPAGTTRRLKFVCDTEWVDVTVYAVRRNWLKWHVSWAVSPRGTHEEHDARIRDLQSQLRKLV